ncbi:MAG: endonuclease VIII [Candidatus Promineifilaceae bacterium]
MPEGPEIRLAADEIANALVGKVTTDVSFAFPQLKPYEAQLTGATVHAVETYGKALLTRFDNGLNIYSHNQLYGLWQIRPAHDYPDTKRQLRLAIHNETHSALLYSASDIQIVRDPEVASHPFISKLGPDLLDMSVTVEQVAARLVSKRFKRRGFPALLLDQHFLAGLGNYLRTEALFVARLWPKLRPVDCTAAQIEALAAACVNLTRQSYQTHGLTVDLKLAEQLKVQGETRRQYRWWVFGRNDHPCRICHTPILKTELGGRRLYYCPSCQAE